MADMIAAVRVGQERFAALSCPFDAAVELFGAPGQAHVFGVQEDLGAEAAADVGCDHAHLVFGQAQYEGCHQQALDVRILVGHVQRVFLGRAVIAADRRTGLHRVGDQAVVHQIEPGHVRRLGKGGIDLCLVAQCPLVAVVVGRFGV